MPNIATLLKSEISRIARKEIRTETASLTKAASIHRSEIAALKRRTLALESELRRLSKVQAKATKAEKAVSIEQSSTPIRFSAKGLASQRNRLGLSANDCGLLLGTSGQSVYNWESGSARPRTTHLAAIASLRTMGKKDAAARLESLR